MNEIPAKAAAVDLTKIRLVLMDIDGTLLSGSGDELGNVRHQLNKLTHRHKVKFSFATGRTLFGARSVVTTLCGEHRNPLIIAYNGGVIASSDAAPWINRYVIDKAVYLKLIKICRKMKVAPLVYTCEDTFNIRGQQEMVFTESAAAAVKGTEFNGMPINLIQSLDNPPTADIIAVLVANPNGSEIVDRLAIRLKKECGSLLRVTTSGGRYVEIAHPQATKYNAMGMLCGHLGVNVSEVMAIGDNFNDLEMLGASGFGVAVANSPNEVKRVCRYVCKHDAAMGVVEALMLMVTAFNYKAVRQRSVESVKGK